MNGSTGDARAELQVRWPRSQRFTDPKGRAVSSKLSIREDGLKLVWSGKDGRRTDTWTQQGDTLTLDVRISAPELPRAIVWTVVYQRRETP